MKQSSYSADLIRRHDYDRYLCSLFAPPEIREAWFVLFAFNHEIASIAEIVSEEMIGHIRLVWWKEALDEIYDNKPVRKHPVVEALAAVIRKHSLPRSPFDTMLTARVHDLAPEGFDTIEALETYCHDTSSSLLQLCALAAGMSDTPALSELGIGWALTGFARLAAQHKSDLSFSVERLTGAAQAHLQNVRFQGDAAQLFMPFLKAATFYLKRLQRGNHTGSRVRLILRLWLG